MPVRLTLVGQTRVKVDGIASSPIPASVWKRRLEKSGFDLQGKVADSFAAQKVAGSRALKRNTSFVGKTPYDAWKVKQGFDGRRGHKTRFLQNTLNTATLYYVRVYKVSAEIVMTEARLHATVPYAEYYEEAKVQGGQILALARSWVAAEEAKLRAWEAQEEKRHESAPAKRLAQGATIGRFAPVYRGKGANALMNAARRVR